MYFVNKNLVIWKRNGGEMLGDRRWIDELQFPSLKVSCTVKLSSIMKWLWLEFSSAVLLGTGKLLLNNARFVTETITGQVWECTLALRISL